MLEVDLAGIGRYWTEEDLISLPRNTVARPLEEFRAPPLRFGALHILFIPATAQA